MDFFNHKISTILKIIIIILLLSIIILIKTKETKSSEPIEVLKETEPVVEKEETIYVDIKGAVILPGVYELPANSLLNDAINIAGGLTEDATTKYTNLSKKLKDEAVIYIYSKKEIKDLEKNEQKECICSNPIINNSKNNKEEENINDAKVSINTATKEELIKLNGIGDAKAAAIIKYRNENGKFEQIVDIKNVPGISESLYEKIKDNLKL